MEKKFYVYKHTRLDSGEVFYIGKGQNNRAWSKSGRNKYWTSVYKKIGLNIEILEYFDDEKEALSKEIEMIKYFRAIGQCTANFNEGGSGLSGRKHTEESLKKISNRSRGKNNPMYGLKRPHSNEELEKMRGENHPFSKKVIDLKTNVVHPSAGEAARKLGIKATYLAMMLNGLRTNKTTLRYLEK